MGQEDKFEWDDKKAALNLDKHHIDIRAAKLIFDDPHHFILDAKPDTKTGEPRYQAIGQIRGLLYKAIYVKRDDRIRFISFHRLEERKAHGYTQSNSRPIG
jgi:uncharacterized protein